MKTNNDFKYICNNEINSLEVKLVQGTGLIQLSLYRAIDLAEKQNLDLVQINDDKIPICKLINFNKFIYDQKQKQKLQAKKNRENAIVIKEIKFRLTIENNDLDIKIKKIQEFINSNFKVKIEIILKGREIMNKNPAKIIMEKVINSLEKFKKETDIQEGTKTVWTIISPKN